MGIGRTKTLAKLANYAAKRWQKQTGGVVDLSNFEKQRKLMAALPVDEVWGVGRRISKKLEAMGIKTVLQLADTDIRFIRKHFPDLPIHASTQMTLTGVDGAKFLEKEGAQRIVTSRELSMAEVKKIADETELEIESFVHGALCYCYSGQCLMSSMIGGRSGNRGQ